MRFVYGIAATDPRIVTGVAQVAERAGFDVLKVPDSICYPEVSDSTYPYSPSGAREFLDGKPFLDPFCSIAAMGAVTSRVRFLISVLKLPLRHPVLVAKQISSVAALTGDRVSLGVGTSPWPDDYEVLGVPWPGRGRRMDEAIEVVRGLTAGGYYAHHGDVFDLPSIKIDPTPSVPIPILVGGHAEVSLRRAARIADGWVAAGIDRATVPGILARIEGHREEAGTADRPFEVHLAVQAEEPPEGLAALAELGVTHVAVNFTDRYAIDGETPSLAQITDRLETYGRDVIAPYGAG
jgi:probable F420-dependent oxidoreductase